MNNIRDFIKYIHGENHSEIRVFKYWDKAQRKVMCPISIKQIPYENKNGDIYYIVNSGGKKDNEITKFNASFTDLDCGRDKQGDYFPIEIVKEYKNNKLKEISGFQLKPTLIIETRNGFHVYWVYEENENTQSAKWIEIQQKLINKFDGDEKVKNPARLMRLPFTKWMKDPNNPFDIKIIEFNDIKYKVEIIEDSLKDIIIEAKEIKDSSSLKSDKPLIQRKESNIEYIKKLDIKGLQDILYNVNSGAVRKGGLIDKSIYPSSINPPKTPLQIVTNRNELYQAIGQINLIEFLGLDSNYFRCIFHDDNNASASIFIGNDGNYIYKCHSSSCGFVGGIIRIVERLAKCNKPKAINFIKAVYGIELQESEWQKEQKEILQANIDYLLSNQMQKEYPELYKRIKNYTPILVVLHNIAMNNVKDENISDSEDVVFFSSLSSIKEEYQSNSGKVSDRINLFAFLELINKLDSSQIPEHLLNKAKHEAAKKKQRYLVNYYSIPSYSDENLNTADGLAKLFLEKNMTMKGWSRELLLRTFGKEIADKVYPQFKEVAISESSYKFEKEFSEILFYLIANQGYATEKQCLEILDGYKEVNHVRMKRMLQEVMEKYDFKRIRANKQIKEQYGITSNGYPFIIVKGD